MPGGTTVRYDEVVDQRVVGCVVAHHKGKRNGITQAKVGRYGTEVEPDVGIVRMARLRQCEGKRHGGINALCKGLPLVATRHAEADVVGDTGAIVKCR